MVLGKPDIFTVGVISFVKGVVVMDSAFVLMCYDNNAQRTTHCALLYIFKFK